MLVAGLPEYINVLGSRAFTRFHLLRVANDRLPTASEREAFMFGAGFVAVPPDEPVNSMCVLTLCVVVSFFFFLCFSISAL